MNIMSKPKKALLLIGSPKGVKSASFSLGSYFLEGLQQKGLETRQETVDKLVCSKEQEREVLLTEINSTDLLIIASPLYVDSLPAALIRTMELINFQRTSMPVKKNPIMLSLINSGFPEAFHNNTALSILQRFSEESGFQWAGGLALGGGGAVDGKPLKSAGGMVKNVTKSLDIAISALAEGKEVPREAAELMAKPMMPKWLLTLLGGFIWRHQAKKYGVQNRLNDRPYEMSGWKGESV